MPEKNIDVSLPAIMILISFLATLAKSLDDNDCQKFTWGHFLIQLTIGTISGIIFGFFACWIVGKNIYAVGALSGAGSVLGVKGLKNIATIIEKYLINKLK